MPKKAMSTKKQTPVEKVEAFRAARPYTSAKLLSFSGDSTANLTDTTQPFKFNAVGMSYHVLSPEQATTDYITAHSAPAEKDASAALATVVFVSEKQFKKGPVVLNSISSNVAWESFVPLLKVQKFNGKNGKMSIILDKNANPVVVVGLGDVIDGFSGSEDLEHLHINSFNILIHKVTKYIKQNLDTTNIHIALPDIHLTYHNKTPFGSGNGVKDKDDDEDENNDQDEEDRPAVANKQPQEADDVVSLDAVIQATIRQVTTANHVWDKYFKPSTAKEKNALHLKNLFISTPSAAQHASLASFILSRNAINLAESEVFARELGNERSSQCDNNMMEKMCQTLADAHASRGTLKLTMHHHDELKNDGYNLIVSVGAASDDGNKERIAAFEYTNTADETSRTVALVGKSLTFDTGGLCLKGPEHQYEMSWDKLGAVNFLATMRSLVLNDIKLPHKLMGMLAIAENAIGSRATHPGSFITESNGSTSEIIDTDAEGRMVLASTLVMAQKKYGARDMITMATLTGSVCSTLGTNAAGVFSNDIKKVNKIMTIGQKYGEPYWHLPIFAGHHENIEGAQSDLQNCTIAPGSDASNAAAYLETFIQPKNTLLHLDVAGVASISSAKSFWPSGVTGFGVHSVYKYLAGEKL